MPSEDVKCKDVKYCNATCKKKHRSKHKKQCERRVAEMHEDMLFKEPPPECGDCPICFLQLPSLGSGRSYKICCGKEICSGCFHAPVCDNQGNIIPDKKCPFCRTPNPTTYEDIIERFKKRMEVGDAQAFCIMGNAYAHGRYGLLQNSAKAVELWRKGGKVGYNNIGKAYGFGIGVERDEKMAKHCYELAAMEGCSYARHDLGVNEYKAGNYDRALKHCMIAVRGGDTDSVKEIQRMYKDGYATKDHYAKALRDYQAYLVEIKSPQRDKAAAFRDQYRYY